MSKVLQLSREITKIKNELNNMPRGFISFGQNGGYVNWYYSDSGQVSYLSKKQREFAGKLCLKNYYMEMLPLYEKEFELYSNYLHAYELRIQTHREFLDASNPNSELIYPILVKDTFRNILPDACINAEYGEGKINTHSGNKVRSKSEALIADALFARNIEFRYEMPLEINGYIYYPDFTIVHPLTGELIYWEHFGLWDNVAYREKACNKLNTYGQINIVPGINLITSIETSNDPIDIVIIEELIDRYLS